MSYRLPPLASLRIFEAAARHGSFRQAADELGITPSAVSHGMDGLESWLAVSLFERSGRSLRLTRAGEDLLPYVAEGLSMIATGARRISPILGARRIALSVAPTFARRWLVPRLAGFRALWPDVSLHIDTSHRQAVFPLDGVDIAIRMGAGPWPGADARLLFRESIVPVTSPAVLPGIMNDERQVEWGDAQLIHVASVEHDWPTWFEAHGLEAGTSLIHVDSVDLALEAAAAGLGVALCRLPLCSPVLDGPDLTQLPFDPLPIRTGYWATVPLGGEPRREVDGFLEWLQGEAATFIDEQDSSMARFSRLSGGA